MNDPGHVEKTKIEVIWRTKGSTKKFLMAICRKKGARTLLQFKRGMKGSKG